MTVDIRRTAGELPFFGRRALECFWIAVPFAASASKVYGGDYDGDIGFQDGLYGARRSWFHLLRRKHVLLLSRGRPPRKCSTLATTWRKRFDPKVLVGLRARSSQLR